MLHLDLHSYPYYLLDYCRCFFEPWYSYTYFIFTYFFSMFSADTDLPVCRHISPLVAVTIQSYAFRLVAVFRYQSIPCLILVSVSSLLWWHSAVQGHFSNLERPNQCWFVVKVHEFEWNGPNSSLLDGDKETRLQTVNIF